MDWFQRVLAAGAHGFECLVALLANAGLLRGSAAQGDLWGGMVIAGAIVIALAAFLGCILIVWDELTAQRQCRSDV